MVRNSGNAIVMVRVADLLEFGKGIIEEYRQANLDAKDDVYYTREQFAERKGVSLGTLWRWENAGILKGTRRGSRVFYRDSDLMEK
jgi:hypothetical protein